MIDFKKCEECGANLEQKIQDRIQGAFCNQCKKWVIVTTYMPAIFQDTTKYKMYLCSADSNNKEHIKALSQIANINFLQAKRMIK
ncbi:MAG: hypothetical protein KI793_19290 [Rivularia sp. (in: Bacteria)]|nr:hypothetical protein [Rivularia sp. MS3]